MTLWSKDAAAAATGGAAMGDWEGVGGVSIDTREIAQGDMFVALVGARDGHDFVAQALENGAGAALVSHRPEGLAADAPLLICEGDTLAALERLGAAGRARAQGLTALAVTGSVGKTTTKDMLRHILEGQGATHAAARSFNNHIGTPLTLARTPQEARFGVFEVGMNHPGEIAPLAKQVRPHVGLITTIAPAHLEAFGALEGVAEEKASLFEGLEPGGTAVLNRESDFFEVLAKRAHAAKAEEVLEFGKGAEHANLRSFCFEAGFTMVEAELFGQQTLFKIGAVGRHFAVNALGALMAAHAAGANLSRAVLALASWRPMDGRGVNELVHMVGGAFLLVDESYNANPASMRAALESFAAAQAPGGDDSNRLAFLTDMLELGPQSAQLHAELAAAPALNALDKVHTAGPMMRALHDALPESLRGAHVEDGEALAELASRVVQPGDAAMVKGSLGSRARLTATRLRAMGTNQEAQDA